MVSVYHAIHVVYFSIAVIDFPKCIIGDQQELTAESLASTHYFLPRFFCR